MNTFFFSDCNSLKTTFIPITIKDLFFNDRYSDSEATNSLQNIVKETKKKKIKNITRKGAAEKHLIDETKRLKNEGKRKVNRKSQEFPEKQMKRPCNCRLKCYEFFSEEQRLQIFSRFRSIGDTHGQWVFLVQYTKRQPTHRQTTDVTVRNRQYTFLYFLPISDTQNQKVCQAMFLNTLSICNHTVRTAWQKCDGSISVDIDRPCINTRL